MTVSALIATAVAAATAFALASMVLRIGRRLNLVHNPGPGRFHTLPVVRLGGLAILPAFLLALTIAGQGPTELFGVYVGAIAITAIGLTDDLFDVSPFAKLVGQTAVGVAAVALGVRIVSVSNPFGGPVELNPAIGGALTVLWLVGMVNAVNLLDGLDGLAPGVVLVSAVILAVLSNQLGNGALVLFGLALAGSIAGFLPLNAYRARLILGDSGSNLLGFLIGSLAVLGQAKIGTTLLVLGIPILDVAWTIIRRSNSGRPITARDTEHLHHGLVRVGLSKPLVAVVYVSLCAAFGCAALLLERTEKLVALMALTGLTALLLYIGAKRASTDNQ